MVRITVFRIYSPDEAVSLADHPSLLDKRIKADRERPPTAIIEARDAAQAAAFVDMLSCAFGVTIMDIAYDVDSLPRAHPLVDQGKAMLKDAKRLSRKARES